MRSPVRALSVAVFTAALLGPVSPFQPQPQRTRTALHRRRTTTMAGELPRDVRGCISQMTSSTQEALRSRCSRMDIELPPGAELGVEKGSEVPKEGGFFGLGEKVKGDAQQAGKAVQRSDRELARLYTEMFASIKDGVSVAFGTAADADAARGVWGASTPRTVVLDPSAKGVASGGIGGGAGKKKGKKGGKGNKRGASRGVGFASKLDAAMGSPTAPGRPTVPAGTEVLLVVAPRGGVQLSALEQMSRDVGMGCCIILLNARLETAGFASDGQREYFLEEFEPVYHVKPPPPDVVTRAIAENEAVPTPIISRAYPHDWRLSAKPVLGPPKLVSTFAARPEPEALVAALTNFAETEGEGFPEQAASLFGKLSNLIL